jgi:hypothetical protein
MEEPGPERTWAQLAIGERRATVIVGVVMTVGEIAIAVLVMRNADLTRRGVVAWTVVLVVATLALGVFIAVSNQRRTRRRLRSPSGQR